MLAARLTDPRKPRGIRHSLGSLVSVLVAGVACGYSGPLAIAGAAAGWDQEVLAGHGTRRNPRTGAHEPPSASTLGRLPALLDADELEAGLTGWAAPTALDPRLAARIAGRAAAGTKARGRKKRHRRPPAAGALRQTRADGWVRAAPGHPWLDPAVTGDPAHRPARPAVGVDGKERRLAKAGGKKKVHPLGAVTHVTGLVIGQDKAAKAGKANECVWPGGHPGAMKWSGWPAGRGRRRDTGALRVRNESGAGPAGPGIVAASTNPRFG